MAMSVERLDVLVKVAESRTDKAAEEVGRSRSGLNEQENRLRELRRYLDEYRANPMPLSIALIANRERFLSRLGEAEIQQARAVITAGNAVRESMRSWLEQRAGQQKFGVLQTAAIDRQTQARTKQEQKQSDEFALRRFGGASNFTVD
ncbi:MAG: flagellar export protein FliJ [Panacagrimonas sp.]